MLQSRQKLFCREKPIANEAVDFQNNSIYFKDIYLMIFWSLDFNKKACTLIKVTGRYLLDRVTNSGPALDYTNFNQQSVQYNQSVHSIKLVAAPRSVPKSALS